MKVKDLEGYFEDLCNTDTHEQVAVQMCGFDRIREVTTSEELRLR